MEEIWNLVTVLKILQDKTGHLYHKGKASPKNSNRSFVTGIAYGMSSRGFQTKKDLLGSELE